MSQQSVCLAVEGDVLSRGGIVGEKICDNTSLIGAFVSGVWETTPEAKLHDTNGIARVESRPVKRTVPSHMNRKWQNMPRREKERKNEEQAREKSSLA